jgi:ABC-type Fe3+-siderophore transport system permease subunit
MFKKELFRYYITTAVTATLAFGIPMVVFLKSADYNSTYFLFIGNILFLTVIALFVWSLNKRQGENASTQSMRAAGIIATICGIVLSVIVAAIALFLFVPDIFNGGQSDIVLQHAPSQTGTGKTHGLVFLLFMNTIIGNFCGGSIASILIPITARKNQTKDKKSEVLNN